MLIYITGITCYNQNISNLTNNAGTSNGVDFKLISLVANGLAIINCADVLPYGNICYVKIAVNNKILLGNKKITNLNIETTNEYGELLTDLDNWCAALKFVFGEKNLN